LTLASPGTIVDSGATGSVPKSSSPKSLGKRPVPSTSDRTSDPRTESGTSPEDEELRMQSRKRDHSGTSGDSTGPAVKRVPPEVRIILQSSLPLGLSHSSSVLANRPQSGIPVDYSDNSLQILAHIESGKFMIGLRIFGTLSVDFFTLCRSFVAALH
jgi:hypothetical protein